MKTNETKDKTKFEHSPNAKKLTKLCTKLKLPTEYNLILFNLLEQVNGDDSILIDDEIKQNISEYIKVNVEVINQCLSEKKLFKENKNGVYKLMRPELISIMKCICIDITSQQDKEEAIAYIKDNPKLPATAVELQTFVVVARERVDIYQSELRVMKKLNVAAALYNQKLEEAQLLGEMLLDAEVKLGELLHDNFHNKDKSQPRLTLKHLDLNKNQSYKAQKLSNNIASVEKIKKEAIENHRIPVRAMVLTDIRNKAPKVAPTIKVKSDKAIIDEALAVVVKMCKNDAKWFDYARNKIDHADMLGS